MASPPSGVSSPSHAFSFTISLRSPATLNEKTKAHQPPLAIDLSPADDIFFHGQMLPFHLLSSLPTVSPRSSANSSDSFTLPELLEAGVEEEEDEEEKENPNVNNNSSSCEGNCYNVKNHNKSNNGGRSKIKSISLFGLKRWWTKRPDGEDNENRWRKLRFPLSHFLKRCARMVTPLQFFKGKKEDVKFRRQSNSQFGNLCPGDRRHLNERRGEFPAPASLRTSPTNSGHLLAIARLPSPTSDSTTEELQAAIQAAIAHCKNSIVSEENLKS
ncbi:hypothetical protein Nepgr_025070 [Nepenthes gracilis]|uniref:Uncharacterized protein n=1 Tax=Nepenthes gracilis TaxID=150966 RepID=A0AAD3T5T7_NEPGR|nr:hypothetical protein Nepgr_025070 [Nepenthes gracilis]